MSLNITVNGASRTVNAEPLTPLLHVLREELDVLSPKAGCQNGGCGTCTVLVDGEPRRSCLLPIAAVEGAEIRTVEGLAPPGQLSPLQEAWAQVCGRGRAGGGGGTCQTLGRKKNEFRNNLFFFFYIFWKNIDKVNKVKIILGNGKLSAPDSRHCCAYLGLFAHI